MDLPGRASLLLANHIEKLYQNQNEIIGNLDIASQLIVNALLQDGKVFSCGNGTASTLANILTSALIDQYEHERPGLPSLNLNSDTFLMTSMANEGRFSDIYSKPIRTLGCNKDILVIYSVSGNCSNLIQSVQAAHDKEMSVIAIVGEDSSDLKSIMLTEDIYISLSSNEKSSFLQLGTLFTTILLDLIDCTIFGAAH